VRSSSVGGLIAQSLTVQAPARVRSLILVDTALVFQPPENYRDRAARVRADGIAPLADGVIARWVTPAFLEAPETTGLRTMRKASALEGGVASSSAPTTTRVWARIERLVSVKSAAPTLP
jgi:pimeloyl-ACP methyl ester carboxylesterase